MHSLLSSIRQFVSGSRSRAGNVAIIFSIAIVPIIGSVGAAVDYSMANANRSSMQKALDATALALAKLMPLTQTQLDEKGWQFFSASIGQLKVSLPQSGLVITTPVTGKINLVATGTYAPQISGFMGVQNFPVSVNTEVQWGISKVEIALVLDNTGSMAGTKISTLKTAATDFVDTMAKTAAGASITDPIKISLVPYSMTVNIGTTYQTAAWMTGIMPTAYGTDIFSTAATNRFALFAAMKTAWGGCVESRVYPYDTLDTAPNLATPATMFVPFFSPDEPDTGSGYVNNYLPDITNSSDWRTRQGFVAKYIVPPLTGPNAIGYVFGPNSGCLVQPLVRLTKTFNDIKTGINGMVANGDTNIAAGAMWGWHTLSPNTPFADGVSYTTTDTTKILILMSDGQNNNADANNNNDSYYGGLGFIWQNRLGITSGTTAQRRVKLDERLLEVCTNIKAKNIQIYTIAVEIWDTTAKQMLEQCASSTTKYYDVENAANLSTAFQSIGKSITTLHLSQ